MLTASIRNLLGTGTASFLLAMISFFAIMTGVKAQNNNRLGIRQANRMNDLKIAVTRYIGDCPGQEWNRPKVHFVSSTPLAPNRRVRIYNQSLMGKETPYTDREYQTISENPYLNNQGSEFFYIARMNEHSDRALSLVEGKNEMVAIIYEGGRDSFPDRKGYEEIEVYEFTVNLKVKATQQKRNLITSHPTLECDDPNTSLASCAEKDKVKVRYTYCQGSSPRSGRREVIRYVDIRDDRRNHRRRYDNRNPCD